MPNDYLHSRVGRYATETVSIDDIVWSHRRLWANKMVMGYLQSTARFNKGKIGEFNERKFFKEPKPEDIQRWLVC